VRGELVAYASLGFAAVAAVVMAVGAAFNLAADLDRIANGLKSAPAAVARTSAAGCELGSLMNTAGTKRRLAPSSQTGEAKPGAPETTVRGKADLPTG